MQRASEKCRLRRCRSEQSEVTKVLLLRRKLASLRETTTFFCAPRFATAGFDNVVKIWSTSTEDTELDVKKDTDPKKSKFEQRLLTRTPLVSLASHTEAVTGEF